VNLTGQQISKYRFGPLLGEGGMAKVYMGEHIDPHMTRRVAIKVLLAEHCANVEVINRFMNEARALGRITHPGVVSVFEIERLWDGRVCIIMEFLNGQTLRDWLRQRGRISVEEALDVAIQLSDALAAAHDQQIIHRDIKPDNVFAIFDHAGMRTKILDFGIAKLAGESSLVNTGTQAKLGTIAYMSPEQFRSSKDVDHRADQYSLGCMLLEMLCGRTPFVADNVVEAMRAHAFQQPPLLRTMVPNAPVALEQVIQRLLAKTPDERFGSMRELKQVLETIRAGGHPDVFAASAPMPVYHGQEHGSGTYPVTPQHRHQTQGHEASSGKTASSAMSIVIVVLTMAIVIGGAVGAYFAFGG
jgi:eukaryotic-like serine/threonine-protein kinase